jgi:hypothetical protein
MEYLLEKFSSRSEVSELTWKKVDRLEAFAASHAAYSISNKLWLCLEKYAGTYMACGFEEGKAIDVAMAAKLVPSVIAALSGKLSGSDAGLFETIENIFGEDNVETCKDIIKNSGATLA